MNSMYRIFGSNNQSLFVKCLYYLTEPRVGLDTIPVRVLYYCIIDMFKVEISLEYKRFALLMILNKYEAATQCYHGFLILS